MQLIISVLLCLTSFISFGQNQDNKRNDANIFINPHLYPVFPGGEIKMHCFINKNINKNLLNSVDTFGVAWAEFIVDTSGQITNIKVIKSLTTKVDNELIRIIKLMPKWQPGRFNNKVEEVKIKFPLKIPYKMVVDEKSCK